MSQSADDTPPIAVKTLLVRVEVYHADSDDFTEVTFSGQRALAEAEAYADSKGTITLAGTLLTVDEQERGFTKTFVPDGLEERRIRPRFWEAAIGRSYRYRLLIVQEHSSPAG